MSSRMDKYEFTEPELAKRTEKNADLYQKEVFDDYQKINLNSNVSILKTDGRKIDVEQIREMLDKKYRDNLPQRKSINIEMEEAEIPSLKMDTKEYDINQILADAKKDEVLDYGKERLKKVRDTNYNILNELSLNEQGEQDDEDLTAEITTNTTQKTKEQELLDLISTITQLETKETETELPSTTDLLDLKGEDEATQENTFYTGDLSLTYDDFDNLQDEIKSNNIIIKILVSIFILVIIAVIVFFLNKYLNWGLF